MNYKVGDTVVCIDAKQLPKGKPTGLRVGQEYKVLAIVQCKRGKIRIGINNGDKWGGPCVKCGCAEVHNYVAWRFIKLPEVTARSEVTSEAEAV